MFRHQGKKRTFKHNLQIASFLSLVAGMVNVVGFLSIQLLTTNITGHFTFLLDTMLTLHMWEAFRFFLYIFFFFFGSFFSSFLIEFTSEKYPNTIFLIPIVIESLIFFLLPFLVEWELIQRSDFLGCTLLFAMGLQNSLVTTISNATVRTTHLTGLFTDLGIEISQLFFYKKSEQRKKLHSSIKLWLTIIAFFFLGGISGGILYAYIQLKVLLIASSVLFAGVLFSKVKLELLLYWRRKASRKQRYRNSQIK